jgi:hypothetical protein
VKATSASPPEVNKFLDELREALAEHTRRLRKMAAKKLSGAEDWKEKRSR